MPHTTPVHVTTGRDPYQVCCLLGIGAAGTVMLATALQPRIMAAALPTILVYAWEAMMASAGVLGLIGTFWRGMVDNGLIVQGGAHLMAACALTMFVIIALVFAPGTSAAVIFLLGAIATAGWVRLLQVFRDVRRLHRAADAGQITTVPLLADPDKPSTP